VPKPSLKSPACSNHRADEVEQYQLTLRLVTASVLSFVISMERHFGLRTLPFEFA
jgi:hypothetical protein